MAKHFKEKEKKHRAKRVIKRNLSKATETKLEKRKMGIVSIISLLLFVIVFLYSSINLCIWWKSNKELEKNEKEIFSQVQNIVDGEEEKIVQIDFEKLLEINEDVKAWIYIENTNINYPILQAVDNEYYLKKDINKNYSSCGSIFLDCDSNSNFTGKNTIIYGHNLLNGKMFAELQKIVAGELGNSVTIKIYMPGQENDYQIFSAYTGKANIEMKTENNFKEILEKSQLEFEYDKNAEQNNIITLITCGSNSENRIVVSGIKK